MENANLVEELRRYCRMTKLLMKSLQDTRKTFKDISIARCMISSKYSFHFQTYVASGYHTFYLKHTVFLFAIRFLPCNIYLKSCCQLVGSIHLLFTIPPSFYFDITSTVCSKVSWFLHSQPASQNEFCSRLDTLMNIQLCQVFGHRSTLQIECSLNYNLCLLQLIFYNLLHSVLPFKVYYHNLATYWQCFEL